MTPDPDNEIPVYKDETLMAIANRFHVLDSERLGFMLSKNEINEHGRGEENVDRDMIAVLEDMNAHLKSAYADKAVSKIYIATNQFHIDRLKETLS